MTVPILRTPRRARNLLLASTALVAAAAAMPAHAQSTASPRQGGTITYTGGAITDTTNPNGGVLITDTGNVLLDGVTIATDTRTTGSVAAYEQRAAAGAGTSLTLRGTNAIDGRIDVGNPDAQALAVSGDGNVRVTIESGSRTSLTSELGIYLSSQTGQASLINNGLLNIDSTLNLSGASGATAGGILAKGAGVDLQLGMVDMTSAYSSVLVRPTGAGDVNVTTTGGTMVNGGTGISINTTYSGNITVDNRAAILGPLGNSITATTSGASGSIAIRTSGTGTIDNEYGLSIPSAVRASITNAANTGSISIDISAAIGSTNNEHGYAINATNQGSGGVRIATSAAISSIYRGIAFNAQSGGVNTVQIGGDVTTGWHAAYNADGSYTGLFDISVASGVAVRGNTRQAGYGTILMRGGTLDNAGTISNGAEGAPGNGATIEQLSTSNEVFSITNRTGGTINGGNRAILFAGSGLHGATLEQGSTTIGDIVNGGTGNTSIIVAGDFQGSFVSTAGASADTLTLEATGSITGNVQFGGGDDLFLWRGGILNGLVDGGAGTDAFVSDLGAGNSRSIATLTDFESIEHRSGTLTFTGTLTSPVTVTGGTLGIAGTGAILGGDYLAINVVGAGASIENLGTVTNTGTGGDGYGSAIGIFASSGTTVLTNGSATNSGAEIAAVNSAINHIAGATGAVIVNNYGLIHGYTGIENPATSGELTINNYAGGRILGEGMSGYAAAISHGSGELLTVANAGTITGTDYGISAIGPVTLSNSGTISGLYDAGINLNGNITLTANSGTISGVPFGIYSNGTTGTNSITNDAGGTISGDNGIVLASATTVDNGGTISGAGTAGTGVHLAQTSMVTNSGSIIGGSGGTGVHFGNGGTVVNNAGASIRSGGIGINVLGAAATITNGGTISSGSGYAAIYLDMGGSLTNNSGATITGGGAGIDVRGAAGTIDNHGTINAGNAAGIMLSAGGTATNHATINATGNASSGLRSTGLASTLDNRGTITANIGIRTDASGSTLSNSGTINATSFGIYVPSGSATVFNSGSVNGSVGATMNGGGSITNTGSLIGVSYGITSAGAATTVVNDGTISGGSGAISLSTFNDTVTLNSGSTTIGSISLGNGNDTINIMTGATFGTLAGGNGTDTVVLGGPTTGTLNLATVTSFEILDKVGTGTWTLSGAAASPAMAITAGDGTPSGTLAFSGTGLTGTIKVNGATIRALGAGAFGTGTITAIDPTIQFAATGSYANQIILASVDPTNDPTRLEADTGVVATLTGQILEQGTGQPLVIGGAGTIILTNQNNFWSGGTRILAGATLQGAGTALGNGYGAIANDGTIIFDETGSYSQIGTVSGSGALVKRGIGTLVLGSANSFTGTTTIEAGTLSLSSTGALDSSSAIALTGASAVLNAAGLNADGLVLNNLSGVAGSRVLLSSKSTTLANSANTIFAGTLGGTPTSTGALTKSGAGTLTLTGDNSDLLLPVLINQGTLALSGGGTLASANYVAVNGGTFDISGMSGAGASIKDLRGTGGSVVLGDKLLTITAAANGNSFGGVISGNGGVTLAAGVATLAGANTHSGTTTIASGAQLNLSGAGSLAGSDVAANGFFQLLNADASVRSFSGGGGSAFLNGYTLTIANGGSYAGQFNNGTLNLTGGTLTLTGNNSLNTIALNGGNLTLGDGGANGYLYGTNFVLGDGTLTIDKSDDWTVANISGGAGNLVQAGSGILSLWNNSYTGSTTVNNGRLRLFYGSAIDDASALIIGAAGTAELFGSDETIGSLSGAGSFILNGNMLTINNGGMFSGVIGDSNGGTLVIAGGTLTLTGANANGATTIAQGAGLTLGNGGTGGSVRGAITANGTLTVNRSDSLSVTGLVGGGSLVQAGSGTTRLGGAAGFTGAVTVTDGTLTLDTGQVLSNGSGIALTGAGAVLDLTVAGGTINTLSGVSGAVVRYGDHGMRIVQGVDAMFAGSFDDAASGAISPAPALTLAGTARLILTGQSDLAAVRIDGGTLALAGSGSIGGGVAMTMASGTLDLSGVTGAGYAIGGLAGIGTVTLGDKNLTIGSAGAGFSGVIQGSGGLRLTGGALTLGGVNTYTGTTVIDAGAGLALTGSGTIASPTVTVNGIFDVSGATGALSFTNFTGTGDIRLGNGVLSIAGNGGESGFAGTITQAAGYNNGAVTIASGHQTVTTDWSYGGITTLLNGAGMTIGDGGANGSLSGAITLNGGTLTTNRTGTVQVNGLSGAGTLKIAGPGTTNLAGSGVFTGNVIVADGTLSLSGPNQLLAASSVALTGANAVLNVGAGIGERINNLSGVAGSRVNLGPKGLTVNNSAATLFAGTLQEATFPGSSGFIKNGAGTLTLTGQNMLRGVTVEVGTLALSGTGTLGANAAVSVASGATLDLSGVTSGATEFGGLRDGGTVELGANTLTLNSPDNTSFDGVIRGSGGLTIASGFQILTGANTYTGDTNINSGATLFLNGGSLASGTVIADGALAIGGWSTALTRLTGGGTVRLVFADLSLGASDFSGGISGLGNLAFASGTSTLRGANDYLGTTTIDSGATLALAGAGTIGGGALIAHGAFDISGAGADIEIANLSGNGTVALGANRLTVGWDDDDSDFGGVIGGTGGLTKTGTGVLTLSGANTYSGLTLVDAGTLRLGASGVLADDSTLEVRNGATLDLNGFDETVASFTIAGNLIGSGTLTAAIYNLLGGTIDHDLGAGAVYQRSGVTLLNGTSAGSAVHVEGGMLQLGANERLADTAIVTVLAGATLDLQSHDETIGSLALAGTLGGTGTLTAATYTLDGATVLANLGAGTLIQHSGVSDLNGIAAASTINVTGGTLRLGGSDRLSDTALVAVASGAVFDVQGNSDTIGSLALAGTLGGTGTLTAATTTLDGAIVNANLGTGTLVQHSGISLLGGTAASGIVRIDGGTLRLGGTDRLADGAAVTVARGATLDLQGFGASVATLALAGTLTGTGTLSAASYMLDGATVNANLGTGTLVQNSGVSVLHGSFAGGSAQINGGTLAFDRASATTYGGSFSGSGTVAQIGTGLLALSGNSAAFAGTTTVSGGGLAVIGQLGGNVQVASTLSGTGSIGGTVSIADGAHLVGTTGGTLSMGALTLASGSVIDVTLSQPSATALFAVGGDLTLDGTLNIAAQPSFGAGVYRLFSYGGALIDNGLVLGTVTGAGAAGLSVQTGNIGQVNLVNTSGATLAFWDGAAAARHDNGRVDGGSGSWSLGTRNWTDANGTVNGPMQPVPSFAVFQGNGGAVTIDNGAGQVSATGMQFATGGYTLSGGALALSGTQATIRVGDGTAAGTGMTATIASALTGGAMLVKTDLGTLVLTGANSYAGGTAVQAGTLIGNAASIQGSIQNAGTVVFDQAGNASFAGTISGGGSYVKSGAGALTLTGASSSDWRVTAGSLVSTTSLFTGNVDLSQGTSLVFSQAANGTYAGTLGGTGSVLFQGGGTVLLTGNSAGFAGAATVGAGSLFSLNGTLGGTIDVLAGGRLQGSGTAGSASIAGTIAPGNSIGTLAFTGNLAFASGSVFEVEANAAGQSDKIVVGGSASIASGATVRVLATDGNYAANTSYTILTAAGGLSGTFSNVTTNLAFLTPTLAYGVNAVTLNLKRNTVDFIAVAQTGNQAAVAPRVQALGAGNGVYEAVAALTAPEARAAFDQLAGSDYASMRASLVEDSRFMRDAMLVRDEMAGADGLAAWGRVTGAWRDVDGSAQAQGYKRSAKGFVTGFDGSFGSHWRIGVALGYGTSEFRTSNATHKAESYQAGGSLLGSYGPVSIQLGTAYGWHAIASQRHVAFGSLRQLLGDNYDARTFQAFGQLGVKGSIGGIDLQPFVGLAHVALFDSGVNEHGGAAALHGGGNGFDATYGSLGLKARIGWDLGGTRLSLDGSAAARRVFGDRVPGIDLAFAGGSAFQAHGIPLDRSSAAVDLGLALDLSEHIRLGVSYTGTYADRSSDHGARAQLSWRF